MFRWAATGLGQYAICDKLNEAGVEPWGKPYKGMPARWTPFYISEILSSRSTIGEYQPHTKREIDGVKKRVPDGDPVSYYPAVVPLALFQKVQDVRRTFAQTKFGASFLGGRDLHSDKNLFRKLVWDVTDGSPVSMVYRYATTSPCLVTTHRKHVRSHKFHYATFERIMLEFLSAADWKAIAREGTNIPADLLTKQESLAKEIDDTEKVLHRYEAIVDDPDSDQFERIHAKFKATLTKSKQLAEERTALEAQIAAQDRAGKFIIETEGIDIYPVDRNTKEGRLKLRSYLAQRIERIDITFGARDRYCWSGQRQSNQGSRSRRRQNCCQTEIRKRRG
jgi:hypothetical protein